MADIHHYVTIEAPADRVFEAVATAEGIASWWTPAISGGASEGETFRAEFATGGFGEFEVIEVTPGRSVAWRCVANDSKEWIGTTIGWNIESTGEASSVLRFTHADWAEASDFFASCNFFWGRHMSRIARLAMTGEPQTSDSPVPTST